MGLWWEERWTESELGWVVCEDGKCWEKAETWNKYFSLNGWWFVEREMSLFLNPVCSSLGTWRLSILKFSWCKFLEWEFEVWLLESCHHCWVLGAIFMSCINVCLERKRKGEGSMKDVLGICLVETTRWKSGTVEQVFLGGLLRLEGNCW